MLARDSVFPPVRSSRLLAGPARASLLDPVLPVAGLSFAMSNRNNLVRSPLLAIYHRERKTLHKISAVPSRYGAPPSGLSPIRATMRSSSCITLPPPQRFGRHTILLQHALRQLPPCEARPLTWPSTGQESFGGPWTRDCLRFARIEIANAPSDFVCPSGLSILVYSLVQTLD
jgi:hypothetical protein